MIAVYSSLYCVLLCRRCIALVSRRSLLHLSSYSIVSFSLSRRRFVLHHLIVCRLLSLNSRCLFHHSIISHRIRSDRLIQSQPKRIRPRIIKGQTSPQHHMRDRRKARCLHRRPTPILSLDAFPPRHNVSPQCFHSEKFHFLSSIWVGGPTAAASSAKIRPRPNVSTRGSFIGGPAAPQRRNCRRPDYRPVKVVSRQGHRRWHDYYRSANVE